MKRLAAVALAVILCIPVRAADMVPMNAEQRRASGVGLTPATAVGEVRSIPYPAQVVVPNPQLRVVSAPQDGIVAAMLAAEGDAVNAGETIARVESTRLLEQQRALLEALAAQKLAGDRLERDRAMVADGIISERRLLESRAEVERWTTTVQQLREALRIAGMQADAVRELEQGRRLASSINVCSPIDGVVLLQSATVGERVSAMDPLYRIGNLESLWLEVHVPIEVLRGVREGSPVEVAAMDIPAKVITIGRLVHEEDQGIMVRAEVKEGADLLHPGQFVQVRLLMTGDGGMLRVPAGAVIREDGMAYVFVARGDSLSAVTAEVVAEEPGSVIIRADIAPGSEVVSSGVATVKAAWRSTQP